MSEKKASPASAVAVKTEIIDLPDEGAHGPISVEIRKRHPAELIAALGDVPGLSGPEPAQNLESVGRVLARTAAPLKEVAKLVLTAPPFSFGDEPEEGRAWWGNLSWENQVAIFNAGMRLAGLQSEVRSADQEVARSVARFPADKEGPAAGRKNRTPRRPAR